MCIAYTPLSVEVWALFSLLITIIYPRRHISLRSSKYHSIGIFHHLSKYHPYVYVNWCAPILGTYLHLPLFWSSISKSNPSRIKCNFSKYKCNCNFKYSVNDRSVLMNLTPSGVCGDIARCFSFSEFSRCLNSYWTAAKTLTDAILCHSTNMHDIAKIQYQRFWPTRCIKSYLQSLCAF